MRWVFIVSKKNVIENIKVFDNYFEGEKFTDDFLLKINPTIGLFPKYREGEFYKNEDITIGLYH